GAQPSGSSCEARWRDLLCTGRRLDGDRVPGPPGDVAATARGADRLQRGQRLSAYLAACFVLAAIAASSLGGVYLTWPRRLSAEEWVLHRRLAAVDQAPRHRPGMRVPGLRVGRLPDPVARLRAALAIA